MIQQNYQQLQGLVLQLEAQPLVAQFIVIEIDLKEAKANDPCGRYYWR